MPTFAQLTDLHLRPPGVLTLGNVDADGFVTAAIDRVVADHPEVDAVLVTGDIADLGEEDAYARATMLLSRFCAPVIAMPGNHDRTGALREAFSAFPGFADAPLAGKACTSHLIDGVTVIALDTSVDRVEEGIHHGELGAEQLAWLDETLKACGPALIAMHHPPFSVGIGFIGQDPADRQPDDVLRLPSQGCVAPGHDNHP